ncbi:hypothetical protein Q5424_12060 [Conexibacter sp. JD483]|uniref:hypothetical protein n=1 Tax=unclassified Conexibacter TaxID=2627773 RepID=UPI002719E9DC|nr:MULTISPECIES: hypothetical protein [unclassified Conexibacter]MDO8188054.1 hypothetical protein [Conexibacter sp. CPCC 205706]MDO8200476.1 hypothetical protein [Conexibacter sp. CPCC 205762]MDR9369823.1 hypothetical protein [Conexibacter sp. JD483]
MSFPRWRTLAGVSLAAIGLTAATAQAGEPTDMVQKLDVKITPGKSGTAKKPKPAAINVVIQSPTENPATSDTVVVKFAKGVTFNNRAFPTCSPATIKATRSLSSCPKGSIVGRGTARALGLVNSTRVNSTLKVTAVNSPGNSLQLFVETTVPIDIAAPISGKLVKSKGDYGWQLNVKIPDELQEVIPPIAWAPLTYFQVKVQATTTVKRGKRTVKVPYVATTSCPKGGWPFAADFTFDQGAPFISGPVSATSPNSKCS